MANYEATRYDFDGASLTGLQGISTGTVVPWGVGSIPSGFLECNGQAVSQVTYAALYAVIGTTYGDPGGGNFNVPDLTDRTVVNKSNNKSLASTGGNNTVTATGNVGGSTGCTTLTSCQIPSHAHSAAVSGGGGSRFCNSGGGRASGATSGSAGGGAAHSHSVSANFVGSATSVLQPYLTMVYIIKT